MPDFKQNKFKLNKNSTKLNLILKYIPCLLKGLILTIAGILVLSLSYYKMSVHSDVFFYLCYLFIAFGAFVTGNSTYHKSGGRGIVAGALGSLPLMLLDLTIILIFSFKTVTAVIFIIVPLCIIFGAIGGIVGSNKKKRY